MVGNYPCQNEGKCPTNQKKTLRYNIEVICPVCGAKGILVLRRRGLRYYAYVYHGYQGRKKVEHYVGVAPEPDTPEFEQFAKELEEKRVVRLILPLSDYQRWEKLAQKEGLTLDQLLIKLLRDYENKKREEALTEALRSNTPPPSPTGSDRRTGSTGVKKQWEWWKQGARRS